MLTGEATTMFNKQASVPVNEVEVTRTLETLKNQPDGILEVSPAILNQLAQTMASQDFAALKLDLADAQWQAKNADRLNQPSTQPPARYRLWP